MKYFFSRGWKETGRVILQSRTKKPSSSLVFTNLPSISSDFFGWCIFRLVLFCMKAGVMALCAFLDLRKSFDVIEHATLLDKMQAYGVRATALEWMRSYLSDRTQLVRVVVVALLRGK